jgi:hypothetical protein
VDASSIDSCDCFPDQLAVGDASDHKPYTRVHIATQAGTEIVDDDHLIAAVD